MKDQSAITPRNGKNLQEGEKKIEKYIFSLNKVIGKGSYATVYLGRRIVDETPVAVKVIDKKIFSNTYNVKSIQSEIDIMKKVDHENVVKLLDVYQTNNNMYIVTEFCEEGDLRGFIKKKKKLSEIAAIKILKDILHGFEYLHGKEIIHRDLKPANILINEGVCKISDFGFAKNLEFGENTIMRSIVGTPLYMAPQILNKHSYTNKSDLWSIGLIFYEMIYGQTPWPANNELQLLNNIMTRAVPFDTSISDNSKDFIKKCLKIKEEDRMNWEDAFKHPVLSSNSEEMSRVVKIARDFHKSPRENKENRYATEQPGRSKSQKKLTCVSKGQHNRTPSKVTLNDNSIRAMTPSRSPTLRNRNLTPDKHSPWRF